MAYVASAAIIKRLRELVQEGFGDVRQVAASRLTGSLLDGLDADEARRRGLYTEKPVQIRLEGLRPHPQRLTDAGDVQIHLLPITIRVVRTIAISDQLTPDDLDAIEAAALTDQSAIQHALSWPNNLQATEAGADTGIKGATHLGATTRISGTAGETMDITTECRFELTVVSTPAAS